MQEKKYYTPKEIGENVSLYLKMTGTSQAALAMHFGVHQSTISRIASGNFKRADTRITCINEHALAYINRKKPRNELSETIKKFLSSGGNQMTLIKIISTLTEEKTTF